MDLNTYFLKIISYKFLNKLFYRNSEGFAYFNEILYSCLKIYFTDHHFFEDLDEKSLQELESRELKLITNIKKKKHSLEIKVRKNKYFCIFIKKKKIEKTNFPFQFSFSEESQNK